MWIVITANVVVAYFLGKLLFKSWRAFFKGGAYLIIPDIASMLAGKWSEDFIHSHKLLFFLVLICALIALQYFVWQEYSLGW